MADRERIVSGMRPTGKLHLGNYFGALKNWLGLQDKYECFFFIADWHALTTAHEDTEHLASNSREMLADWLAAGLDPEKCVIFQQSHVVQHAELSLLLGMITPVGWLLRNPAYKEQLVELYKKRYAGQEHLMEGQNTGKLARTLAGTAEITDEKEMAALSEMSSFGFLGYPVLMATDILIYKAAFVPVGQDQLPHVEITRDLARRFSDIFKSDVLREPKPLLTSVPKVCGLDGRKMSKSYNNTIALSEDPASAEKKIMRMFTDPAKLKAADKGNPDGCSVFTFHKLFNPDYAAREQECRAGSTGCVACKKHLASLVSPFLEDFRSRRAKYEASPELLDEILRRGADRARVCAEKTLEEVRRAMRLK